MAGIHGEEAETVFLLSRVLRRFSTPLVHTACVLVMAESAFCHVFI